MKRVVSFQCIFRGLHRNLPCWLSNKNQFTFSSECITCDHRRFLSGTASRWLLLQIECNASERRGARFIFTAVSPLQWRFTAINLKDRPERDSVCRAAALSFALAVFIDAFGSIVHPVTFHPTAPLIIVAHSSDNRTRILLLFLPNVRANVSESISHDPIITVYCENVGNFVSNSLFREISYPIYLS